MFFFKLLFSILVISLVECVPVDDKKNLDGKRISNRRETLDTYKYNHPPSIAIPVSIVFEENGSADEKSGKFLKLKTEIPNEKQVQVTLHEPSSEAIPVSVVFEEETSANDTLPKFSKVNPVTLVQKQVPSQKSSYVAIPVSVVLEEESFRSGGITKSNNLSSKLPVYKPIPSEKPSSEAIPVSVLLEEEGFQNDKALKSEKQNLEMKTKKLETSNENAAVGIPVAIVFEKKEFQNNKAFQSEKSTVNHTPNKQNNPKETTKQEHGTEPTISTSNGSVISNNDIKVRKTQRPQIAEPNLKEEKSKVILRPQPRRYDHEYQIPVAVVYDEPTDVQTSRRLKNSMEQVKMRITRRRRPNSTSTTEPTIKTTVVVDDTQSKVTKSVVKQNIRSRQRVKQTEDKENIPVVIQFTSNENQYTEPKRTQEKPITTSIPTTEANSGKLTSNKRNQSKTPLQTQNRKSSFQAQQKEERKQDYESAQKRERDPVIPIVKSDSHAYGNSGSYSYSYEGGDGTKAFSKGELKTFDDDKTGEAVVGGFSYKDKDGNDISLSYTADENGYHPVGDHLPTPPPIPVAIQRALEYLATKTTPAPVTEASEGLKET